MKILTRPVQEPHPLTGLPITRGNLIESDGQVAYLHLRRAKGDPVVARVDIGDVPIVAPYTWRVTPNRGTYMVFTQGRGLRKTTPLHRFVMSAPDGTQVDHRNHDGLDNRKSNLRLCTLAENCRNRRRRSDNKSGYKGVRWVETRSYSGWRAVISVDGRCISLGCYKTAEEAARAYDRAASEFHGEFAYLNFPDAERQAAQ